MKKVFEIIAAIIIGAKIIGNSKLGWAETLIVAFMYIIASLFIKEERD